jgi:hypothetical protein
VSHSVLHWVPPREEPPTGTVAEVLAWVGDDPRRAQLALEAEQAGQQRSTLIAQLERIVA